MSLKDLTHENHKKAERNAFVKRLLKKKLTVEQYYIYLSNQLPMYSLLEKYALAAGALEGIESIARADRIHQDILALEAENPSFVPPGTLDSTEGYLEYLRTIEHNSQDLLAHVYVRHMGDLSGGQIIKKFVPGSAHHYEFDGDVHELKAKVREKLDDSLAPEANVCFDMIQTIFDDMENAFGDMGPTN